MFFFIYFKIDNFWLMDSIVTLVTYYKSKKVINVVSNLVLLMGKKKMNVNNVDFYKKGLSTLGMLTKK